MALGGFILATLITGVISAWWVYANLAPPMRVTYVAPPTPIIGDRRGVDGIKDGDVWPPKDVGFDFKKDKWIDVKKPIGPGAVQLNFGFDGRATVNSHIEQPVAGFDHGKFGNEGPYRLFRISLVQGVKYNIYVNADNSFNPNLQIFDGDVKVASKLDVLPNRLMLAFQPKRTGDHMLFITSKQGQPRNFFLIVAREQRPLPTKVDLTPLGAGFVDQYNLRVEDPLDSTPDTPDDGPYREYTITLKAEVHYRFMVSNAAFGPIVQIMEAVPPEEKLPENGQKNIKFDYTAKRTGEHRVRVTSDQFGLGTYTFSVSRIPAETILARLDDADGFEDRRTLKATDAVEPNLVGAGPHKVYLLTLQKGQTYTLEMSSDFYDPSIAVYDSTSKQVAAKIGNVGAKNARLTFQANETGTHRIHAAAARPRVQGEYTLKITRNP